MLQAGSGGVYCEGGDKSRATNGVRDEQQRTQTRLWLQTANGGVYCEGGATHVDILGLTKEMWLGFQPNKKIFKNYILMLRWKPQPTALNFVGNFILIYLLYLHFFFKTEQ